MTDRELLENAAKAAGLDALKLKHNNDLWNPLTDDGDAFRLAVKLGMCVTHFPEHMDVMVGYRINLNGKNETVSVNDAVNFDPYSATRLAIVRAAAEIGKAME